MRIENPEMHMNADEMQLQRIESMLSTLLEAIEELKALMQWGNTGSRSGHRINHTKGK